MKKLSKRVLALLLAALMLMTTAPLSAIAATTAPTAKLTALDDAITAYRSAMSGKIYNNMLTAYNSYIEAVRVYDKASYGANDVTEQDIVNATENLTSATATMTASEWTPFTGTTQPTAAAPAFNEDGVNLSSVTNNDATYAYDRVFPKNTGNSYLKDVYDATFQNLAYVETKVQTAKGSWKPDSKFTIAMYVPNSIILYDGSAGFTARIGALISGNASDKDRRISAVYENGNDYLDFGPTWYEAGKNAKSSDEGYVAAISSKYTTRYEKRDLVNALAAPSPNDFATGDASGNSHGTRTISKGNTHYLGNYIEFTIPESSSYFSATAETTHSSMEITSLPVGSISGGLADRGSTTSHDYYCSEDDRKTASISVNIAVLNYSLLIKAIRDQGRKLVVTDSNAYLEGGLTDLLEALDTACSWNPNGKSSSISTLVSTMEGYINTLNNTTPTADDSPYGDLATEMKSVLSVSGTLGKWYNVNNNTDAYSEESIENFVTAFTYAQSVFDQNSNFADSYSFSAKEVTVGSGDTTTTVQVPAASKTVNEVYQELANAKLETSDRVDVSVLTTYIEELTDALDEPKLFGLTSAQLETIPAAITAAKNRIWGTVTLQDELGNDYTVSRYGDDGALKKATTNNQNQVTAQENILRPYVMALTVKTDNTITYDDVTGAQNSLAKIIGDMRDRNLYSRDTYVNCDTLDEKANYVENNFVAALYPNYNDQTVVTRGDVKAKSAEYKRYIKECQDVIDALEVSFIALENGSMINTGTLQDALIPKALESKWATQFYRYDNPVVFRTTKDKSTLRLGKGSIRFYQYDTTAWLANNEYNAVLDAIMLNDTTGEGSTEIAKYRAGVGKTLQSPAFDTDEAKMKKYAGSTTIPTTNGGTYGITDIQGVSGKRDDTGAFIFGKELNGSFTEALATTEGTANAATGLYAYDKKWTVASGTMYLDLPAEESVTLTRSTVPTLTTYTASGYFGTVFFWTADGAGAYVVKYTYNGYYHERTESKYTQSNHVVDMSNLKELIGICNELNKTDYTESSWNNLRAKLNAASSNDFGNGASYHDLTKENLVAKLVTRYQNLYDAWKDLVPAATNIELGRPYAQAQREGKDIGAAVIDVNNQWYTKYNTANDVDAETNPYGTYTTNTWKNFKAAFEAGDLALNGDGTNPGRYATPIYDPDTGATIVAGIHNYTRFVDAQGEDLTLGDIEQIDVVDPTTGETRKATVADVELLENVDGVYLSDEQQEVLDLARNIKSTYIALKRWANFAPVDAAFTALENSFASNYNRVYTSASLKNINTTFSGLATDYYTVANDVEAQHALDNGVAVYDEDDDADISAEATTINGCVPPTLSTMNLDTYTPSAIIAAAEEAATDPDARDATEAVRLATELSERIFEKVNIAPLNNLEVEGVNFATNEEIQQELEAIMERIVDITYTVTIINEANGTSRTIENQAHGTEISLNSTSGKPVTWKYNYESRTVKNHQEITVPATETFDFVVLGDTTIYEGEPEDEATGHKVAFVDNLNHVIDVEYLISGDSIYFDTNKIVINYKDGSDAKEVNAPDYAFYNFSGFNESKGTTLDITDETGSVVVTANYEADTSAGTAFKLTVINMSSSKSDNYYELQVPYNAKIQIDPSKIVATRNGLKSVAGKIYVNDEETSLSVNSSVERGKSLYAMTLVTGYDFDEWKTARDNYSASNSEIPFTMDKDGNYIYYVAEDATIVLYQAESDYTNAGDYINDGAFTTVRDALVLTNTKFTMHGTFSIPESEGIIECGILMYLGDKEIESKNLTIATYNAMPGAYRLKYTKSTEYGNINVSVNTSALAGKTLKVRYKSYVTYKTTEEGKTVYKTIYSDKLATDTRTF